VDKLAELAEASAGRELSPPKASGILDRMRSEHPDFDRVITRRFARLPETQQQVILEVLQKAGADSYVPALQQWSRNLALSLPIRARVLTVLESLGGPIDPPYHEALQQAVKTLAQLQAAASPPLTDTAELQSPWRDAILNLPLALALELAQSLSAEHPTVALAVLRAVRPIVDTKDCHRFVEVLASISLMDSVTVLQDLLSDTQDKTLQKAIKKALHRLRAQGLVFDNSQRRSHTVVVGTATHRLEQCLASHIDGAGDRAIWMIRTKPFGGYNIAYLVINYGTGIQVALGLQASKRELPDLLAKAQERIRLIDLEPAYCQYQVALAQQMNLETRTPIPEEFYTLHDIIGEPTTTFDKAIIYSVLSEADLQEAQAYTDHAEDLLEMPEFAGWTLPTSIIQKYGDQLREIEESQIIVSPALKQEQINEVYARAAEEALAERSRYIMRLRLEEMAFFLLQTERRREALWAIAAAQSMQKDDPAQLRYNRFIGALLERSLESAKKHPSSRIIQPFSRLPETGGKSLRI
jgi:hypothetical protein